VRCHPGLDNGFSWTGAYLGRLHFEGTAEDRAVLVLSTLLSSLLLSRVEGQELFRRMLDRLLEESGANWRTGELPAPDGSPTVYHSIHLNTQI